MRPPKIIKPYVLSFARQVVGEETTPTYVPCSPVSGALQNECFPLVDSHIERNGGRVVLGWAIWEWPSVFIEAEFHAIWCAPGGNIIDIAPRPFPIQRILFVEDARRKYSGMQVDNIRKPLVKDKDVKRFIDLAGQWFRLLNQGKLKHQYGEIEKTPEMARVEKERTAIEFKLLKRYGPWLPESAGKPTDIPFQ